MGTFVAVAKAMRLLRSALIARAAHTKLRKKGRLASVTHITSAFSCARPPVPASDCVSDSFWKKYGVRVSSCGERKLV
jgi:hypothetical protein